MDFENFKYYHSSIILFCQRIEHDLKWIYSYMKYRYTDDTKEPVDIFNELNDKKWNFGNILNELKVLDNKTGNENLISNDDYNFLKQMKDKRNFWCHKCFIEFIYSENWKCSNKYLKISKKLKSDYERFSKISEKIENLRLDFINQNT